MVKNKTGIMFHQYLDRKTRMINGFLNTYIKKQGKNYPNTWWDEKFYIDGISDQKTISPKKDIISTKYHYASIESILLRFFSIHSIRLDNSIVLDIGSGAGHWIDFYLSLGVEKVIGVDISRSSCQYLRKKYKDNKKVEIINDNICGFLDDYSGFFNLINAIGVMFHIVDEQKWLETIRQISNSLHQDGLFIASGQFGCLNGLNVQVDDEGNINKTLRSKSRWKRILNQHGFYDLKFKKNNSYLYFNKRLPESHLLFARKR